MLVFRENLVLGFVLRPAEVTGKRGAGVWIVHANASCSAPGQNLASFEWASRHLFMKNMHWTQQIDNIKSYNSFLYCIYGFVSGSSQSSF